MLLTAALAACASPMTQRPEIDPQATSAERATELALVPDQASAGKERTPSSDPATEFNRARDRWERIWRVMYRLGVASTELCKNHVGPANEVMTSTAWSFPESVRALAKQRYPTLGDRMSVIYVVPQSRAAEAGLVENDVITAVNGQVLEVGDKAFQSWVAAVRKAPSGEFRLSADGPAGSRIVAFDREDACDYLPVYVDSADVNAATDGNRIMVTRGMLDFVQSDGELALVLGHEMGHAIRGHRAAKRQNATAGFILGAIVDIAIGAGTGIYSNTFSRMGGSTGQGVYSQEFEAEADYVGLYLMARAGYAIDDAPNFWRRMGALDPKSITMATDHPTAPERYVALAATIKEIEAKQAEGAALVPNEKASTVTPGAAPGS